MKVPREKVELCVSSDNTRPVLNYVFYDAERKNLVAADGFMMVVVPVDSDHEKSCMIPVEAIVEARKKKLNLVFAEGNYIGLEDESVQWALGDLYNPGGYPDYMQIIPAHGPRPETHAPSISFSAPMLFKMARALGIEKNQHFSMWYGKRTQPIIIKSGSGKGLLMPMHPGFHREKKLDLDVILELLKEVVAEGKNELYPDLVKMLRQYFGFPLEREKDKSV